MHAKTSPVCPPVSRTLETICTGNVRWHQHNWGAVVVLGLHQVGGISRHDLYIAEDPFHLPRQCCSGRISSTCKRLAHISGEGKSSAVSHLLIQVSASRSCPSLVKLLPLLSHVFISHLLFVDACERQHAQLRPCRCMRAHSSGLTPNYGTVVLHPF
jgi:hypothetical protein